MILKVNKYSKTNASLVKTLKKIPSNQLNEVLHKLGLKPNNSKTPDNRVKATKKPSNNWIPTEGSSFDDTLVFVLMSILYDPDKGIHKDFYKGSIQQIRSTYLFLIQHHGITGGTKKWKEQTQHIVLMAEDRNPEPLPWVATVKGPIPLPEKFNSLMSLMSLIKEKGPNWIKGYQALITILSIARLSKEIPDLNLDSITNPRVTKEGDYRDFLKGFAAFVKDCKLLKYDENVEFCISPRARMTQGPNREVTLASSVKEARSLLEDKTLSKSFELFASLTGNSDFYNYVKSLHSIHVKDTSEVHLGRLALVPDSLNKHRLVAMVDYWTNLLFTPLEEYVRSILKRNFFDNDFLRDHSLGSEKVRLHKGPSWSLDLSSWTDRFPLDLQQIVVEKILGKNCGQHWATLLSGRDYWVPSLKRCIRYKVGQPMGSKSSFAVASLAHHILIHYCAFRINTDPKRLKDLYTIVGDDLVVFDEPLMLEIRKSYKTLGVEIQDSKSKFPVGQNFFTEFCSRVSINNEDASRIPPNVIRNASENWRDFPILIIEMRKRGIEIKADLLKEIPFLRKVSKSGKSYLSELQTVLRFPLMGTDLSDLAKDLGDIDPLPLSEEAIVNCVIYMQLLQAVEKIDEANLVIKEQFQMEESQIDNLMELSFSFLPVERHVWNPEGSLYKLACEKAFKVKGWEHSVPHPASLASVWIAFQSYKKFMDWMMSERSDCPDKVETTMLWLKDMGKLVGAILPKEANLLIPTAGNMGSEFVRNQISLYARIFNASRSGKPLVFTKWDIKIDPLKWNQEVSFPSLVVSVGNKLPGEIQSALNSILRKLPKLPTWKTEVTQEASGNQPLTPPPTDQGH